LPVPAPLAKLLRGLFGDGGADETQRAAVFAFVIHVASTGLAYLSQVFLARWMGSFEYGAFIFAWV
jgi:O-antigen/teichoic acid export membrane protein